MKRITIQGNFKIYGDLPALEKLAQPMEYAEIEIEELPIVRLINFRKFETMTSADADSDKSEAINNN